MKLHRYCLIAALAVLFVAPSSVVADRSTDAKKFPSIESILRPGLPLELVSAKKADRIAWVSYEGGKRNVFTAAGPLYKSVRVTSFLKDDGVDLTQVRISDDGSTIAFVRGHTPNGTGGIANPNGDPNGADRTIWAARTA